MFAPAMSDFSKRRTTNRTFFLRAFVWRFTPRGLLMQVLNIEYKVRAVLKDN